MVASNDPSVKIWYELVDEGLMSGFNVFYSLEEGEPVLITEYRVHSGESAALETIAQESIERLKNPEEGTHIELA